MSEEDRCIDDTLVCEIAEGRRPLCSAYEAHLSECAECRQVLAVALRGLGDTTRVDAAAPDAEEPSWDELGQGVVIAGRYQLESFLGAGGMGVVWAARDLDGPHERVAIKVARSTDVELSRRLEREGRIAAALDHPSVVRTMDVLPATATRGACLVQELLIGETLDARLVREGTLSLAEAARIVGAVAAAVAVAHARGVVHRDLKPQNVFLTADRVVVLDFGIAGLLPAWGAHSRLTRTGAVMGTPGYMAPEQLLGEPVDVRADVWGLGALLLRVLTGRTPMATGSPWAAMKALRAGALLGVELPDEGLPPAIAALLRAALVMAPERRLAHVGPFVEL
jgi:eukaryotic-like serine/threonine-protein kinase